jgi:O-antigen/teichoic acid export membrane protein
VSANAVVVVVPRSPELRPALAGAWLLSAATAGSGALAYAFHVLAARTLGPSGYGLIAVLWAVMFIAVVMLFRPLEQTTARAVADRVARGEEVRSVLRSVVAIYLALATAVVVLGAIAWPVLTEQLFEGADVLTLALVAGFAGYGLAYVMRGVLAGGGWFEGYGLLLLSDAGVRIAVAIPLVVVGSTNLAAAAVAAAGIGGLLLPAALGHGRLRRLVARREGPPFRVSRAIAFAGPAGVIAVADQVLVNAGPVLVVLGGGSTEAAGVVFAATMLVRVPVYLFQGLAASLLPNLTRLQANDELQRFARAVSRTSLLVAAAGAAIVVAAAIAGPTGMEILYGDEYAVGRGPLTLLGAGVGLYLLGATFSQGLLALGRVRGASVGWAVSAGLFLVLYAAIPGAALDRIALAFALAALAGGVVLGTVLWRSVGRT